MKTVVALVLWGFAERLAQPFPSKPVRLIVPFPPGGAVDYYARAVQTRLQETLGQPILIENRSGAGGMVGADLVVKAAPDGYTLLVGNIASLAMNVGLYSKMTYDPRKDLTPIIRTVAVNHVMTHPRGQRQGAHRLREGQSRQAELRFGGQRQRAASRHRASQAARRHRHAARAFKWWRADGRGLARRADPHRDRRPGEPDAACERASCARLPSAPWSARRPIPTSRRSPNPASGFRGARMARHRGPGEPAGRHRAAAERGVRQSHGFSGGPPEAARWRARSDYRHAEDFAAFIRSEIDKWAKVAKDVGARVD